MNRLLQCRPKTTGVGIQEELFVGKNFLGLTLTGNFVKHIQPTGNLSQRSRNTFKMKLEGRGGIQSARGGLASGITGKSFLESFGGQFLHFRAGRLELGANTAGETSGDGDALVVAHQIADSPQHALVATLVRHHGRQGGKCSVLQPILLMLEVREQCVDERQHLFHRSAADDLQGSVLDPPGFGRILECLECQVEYFRIDEVGFAEQSTKHGPAHACVLMLQEFHHQVHSHLAAGRFPADVAAIDTHHFKGSDVADVMLLMVNVTAYLPICGLLSTVKTAYECQTGILGQSLARQILFFTGLVGHGLKGEKGIIRFGSPQLLGQLVGLGKFCTWSPCNAQGFARDSVGQRVSHAPLFLVITCSTQDTEGTIETA